MADPLAPLKDAAYTAVGFAVIGLQRAQVQRREIERWLAGLRRDVAHGGRSAPQ